jgi:hypothetical protein
MDFRVNPKHADDLLGILSATEGTDEEFFGSVFHRVHLWRLFFPGFLVSRFFSPHLALACPRPSGKGLR